MKKYILCTAMAVAMAASLVGCGAKQPEDDIEIFGEDIPSDGGWGMYSQDVKAEIPEEAMNAFNGAEQADGMTLEPVALLATQVVAGTNYSFLCKGTATTVTADTAWKIVTVYLDTDMKSEIINIADFKTSDYTSVDIEATADITSGGWTAYTEQNVQLPEEVKVAFDESFDGFSGAAYTPITILGNQVVAGMNYSILCVATPTTQDANPYIAVVTIYDGIEDPAEITSIAAVDMAQFNN